MKIYPSLHKLSNGMVVILDPMDIATTCVSLSVKTGGRDESKSELGITHFFEHMWIKGTKKYPSNRIIKDYIASKSGFINAGTGNSGVRMHGRILSENLDALLELIADLFRNSLVDKKVIDNERMVILDELRRFLDDKDRNFSYFMAQNLFPGSGFANRTIGTYENIKSFTREQMLDYMGRRISAKNTAIVISGKIENSAAVLAQLEKLFSWLPELEVSSNSAAVTTPAIAHNLKPEQKQIMLSVAFEDMFPATIENRFKKMCVSRFRSILSKRLHEEVRSKNGLVYGIATGNFGNEAASVNNICCSSAPENMEKIVELCAQVSSGIITTNLPTQEEFNVVVAQVKLNDADWLESAVARCDTINGFYQQYGLLYDFNEIIAQRNRMTLGDVIENTCEYFAKPISILTQGPEFSADLQKVWAENFIV